MKKIKKKMLILNAALSLFEKKGYHDTKISEIAKLADIGKGTVYEYFESKQSLFEEMVIYSLDMYFIYVKEEIEKENNPIEKLRVLLKLDWELSKNHGQIINVILSRISTFNEELKRKFAISNEKNIKLINDIIDYGIEMKFFKPVDSNLMSVMFKGTFNQCNMNRTSKNQFSENNKLENEAELDDTTIKLFEIFIDFIKI